MRWFLRWNLRHQCHPQLCHRVLTGEQSRAGFDRMTGVALFAIGYRASALVSEQDGICGISAIPSFVIAYSQANSPALALLTGVALFAIGYTALDYSTAKTAIRRNKTFSRTLKITYGTRILITVLFPVALYLDVICGFFSVAASEFLFGSNNAALETFVGVVFTVILQGIAMNIVLACYALVVHLIQVVVLTIWKSIPTG